jgi:hypothetical protein
MWQDYKRPLLLYNSFLSHKPAALSRWRRINCLNRHGTHHVLPSLTFVCLVSYKFLGRIYLNFLRDHFICFSGVASIFIFCNLNACRKYIYVFRMILKEQQFLSNQQQQIVLYKEDAAVSCQLRNIFFL